MMMMTTTMLPLLTYQSCHRYWWQTDADTAGMMLGINCSSFRSLSLWFPYPFLSHPSSHQQFLYDCYCPTRVAVLLLLKSHYHHQNCALPPSPPFRLASPFHYYPEILSHLDADLYIHNTENKEQLHYVIDMLTFIECSLYTLVILYIFVIIYSLLLLFVLPHTPPHHHHHHKKKWAKVGLFAKFFTVYSEKEMCIYIFWWCGHIH